MFDFKWKVLTGILVIVNVVIWFGVLRVKQAGAKGLWALSGDGPSGQARG